MAFQCEGDAIVLLEEKRKSASVEDLQREFSSTEYAKWLHGVVAGIPPAIDLDAEKRLIDCLNALAGQKLLHSAHDVSDGGVAVTLVECCFASSGSGDSAAALSAQVDLQSNEPAEATLFGERGAGAVVSVSPAQLARLREVAAQYGVRAQEIGTVTRGDFRIQSNGRLTIAAPISSLREIWATALERALRSQ
jgi:phosphoribosylformylglycinamidine synthase